MDEGNSFFFFFLVNNDEGNSISTTRYNFLTFLRKGLSEQVIYLLASGLLRWIWLYWNLEVFM